MKTKRKKAEDTTFSDGWRVGQECAPLFFAANMQAKAYRAALEWQIELMGFVTARYRRDIALAERLAACRAPEEAASAWSDYLATTMDDYSRESVRAADIASRMATETTADLCCEAEEVTADMKAAALAVA